MSGLHEETGKALIIVRIIQYIDTCMHALGGRQAILSCIAIRDFDIAQGTYHLALLLQLFMRKRPNMYVFMDASGMSVWGRTSTCSPKRIVPDVKQS